MPKAQALGAQPLPLGIDVPARRIVLHQGQPYVGLFVVEAGAMLATSVDDEGRALALDVMGPGDSVGGPDGADADSSVRTLAACRLVPAGASQVAALLDARARRLASLAGDLAWQDVPTRLGRRLDDLAQRFGRAVPGGIALSLPLTQEDLACMCGTSRESANRALRRLADAGAIEIRGRGRFLVRAGQSVAGRSAGVADAPSCSITRLHDGQ
jgi:CRP/FNR family transcriptional regulator, cyclic AMP receptor protein